MDSMPPRPKVDLTTSQKAVGVVLGVLALSAAAAVIVGLVAIVRIIWAAGSVLL